MSPEEFAGIFFHERTCRFQAFWILDGEAFGPRIPEHPGTIGWFQSDLTLPVALLDFQTGVGFLLLVPSGLNHGEHGFQWIHS